MKQTQEGLNYVPLIAEHATPPPSSARSRISLNRKRSQHSILHYNGNYEGDNGVFRDKTFELERLSMVDSESDTDFQRETTSCSSFRLKEDCGRTSFAWCLLQYFMWKFLKPELREKFSTHIDNFTKTSSYSVFSKLAKNSTVLLSFIFYLIRIFYNHFAALCGFFWRRRMIFYNLARRLLWRLTLAKCSDLSLFLLILASIPALLILSVMGFITSICGYLKYALKHWRHILNKI